MNVPVPYASMFCGALTGSKKPKQITNCCIRTNPNDESPMLSVVVNAINTGIKADASDVALANPR